jgi:hypothetical protein
MMERGVVGPLGKEVEEGWVKIWQLVFLSESVDGNSSDVRLAVDVERGPRS